MEELSRADRNIEWIERHCHIPDGADVGEPARLREWQKDDIRKIYDNPRGTRTAIISYAKKNAKSSLASFLLLLHLLGPEARQNSQLVSTAQSRDQAAVLFDLAANVVRLSPTLDPYVIIRDTLKQLACPELGTIYKALSADDKTAHGKSAVFAVHDEIGQVRGPRSMLYNAVDNAMGAHKNPLAILISTQAPTDADLLSIKIDDALEGKDPRTVISLYTADPDLDPFSEEAIKQANPAYGDFLNAEEIRNQAEQARRMPANEALYRNYQLNQRVEASNPAVTQSVWEENAGTAEHCRVLYGGLDLSETQDLTAFVLYCPTSGGVISKFWLPEEGLANRAHQDRVSYDVWAKQGFLSTCPGRSVDYKFVAEYLADQFHQRDIRKIAFDRWNMKHLRPWLIEAGLSEAFIDDRFVDFGQGTKSMHPAWRNLESLLLNGKLKHDGHPVLRMCAMNTVLKVDEAGWKKFDKKKSRGRIDGFVALAMATAAASEDQHEKPVYPVELEKILA